MERLCHRCKKNPIEVSEQVSFEHLGLRFEVLKKGEECAECTKKSIVLILKKGLVKIELGRLKVNWLLYLRANTINRDKFAYTLYILGIMSFSARGNWEIVCDGPIGLNPRTSLSYLYFTRREDVLEFARLKFSSVHYNWVIRHIDDVIEKEVVLGKR